MKFDAMAAAVDWLDAYRAGDIESILKMYRHDAVTRCECNGVNLVGKDDLRSYWAKRLRDHPAEHLDDIALCDDVTVISYVTHDDVVAAILEFDASGRIVSLRCGPMW